MRRFAHARGGLIPVVVFAAAMLAVVPWSQSGMERPNTPDRARFSAWLAALENTDGETAGLYPYFRSEEKGFESSSDDFLSPMVTAKCVLFWLEEQSVNRAVRIGERLLYWQDRIRTHAHPNVAGALPSQIVEEDGQWAGGDRFYSGDNLVVLEAFLSLYERTGSQEFLDGAEHIARWIKDVMGHGEQYGVWLEPYFAPMQFATADGSFDNRVFTNTAFMWISALRHYGEVTNVMDYIEHFVLAKAFFLQGQSPHGVWFDHYDPGYPPQYYNTNRWQWFGDGGVVVADNAMRAALGALRVGAPDRAERFADWLRPRDGAVFAYLDAATGNGRFAPSDEPYYDVVVSGLWRDLTRGLGRDKAAMVADRFLARTQSAGGGWYWGRRQNRLIPVQRSQAILTGFWAVSNMDY